MEEKIKRYSVGGMSCAACAARVEKAVASVPSVTCCSVSLLTNELSVNENADINEIEKAVKDAGYIFQGTDAKENFGEENAIKIRLIVSAALLAVLMVFMHLEMKWPQIILCLAVMVINRRFFISGFKGIIHLAPNMDTLVSLGSLASFIYGYYDSSAMILTFITIGKMLEARSKGKTTDAIKALKKIVPTKEISLGEIFEVRAGDTIAADGFIKQGTGTADESMLTGESMPVDKKTGDTVSAGTILTSGYLECEATAIGEDTALSKIISLVSDAASTKAPIAKTADKVASVFVPAVICIAVVTSVIWLLIGKDLGFALSRGISVLVISCPCALGLATPVAITVASGKGAKNGILYKTAASIEECGRIDTVVLDKTGTVTKGKMAVSDVIPDEGVSKEELLKVAASLEKKSEHPIGKAITQYYTYENLPEAENFETLPGLGVKAVIEGQNARCGKCENETFSSQGKTCVEFFSGEKRLGMIALTDEIKEDSKKAINAMKELGLRVIMLTGDNIKTAKAVSRSLGDIEVIADVLPQDKEAEIRKLKNVGKVAMVGDGINDAPALTRSDVGIAIGSGTDIAIESADVVLMKSGLMDAYAAIKLGKSALKNIRQNLFWAFFYNSIGIPVAAGVLSGAGITLNPAIAAACMSLSSFCVVSNSLRLNFANIYNERREKTKMTEKEFNVDGMMCPHCEARVVEALEKIPGVESAKASHENKKVTVVLNGDVCDDVIKSAIVNAGYSVI